MVEVQVGEEFAVTLADMPGAGYGWVVAEQPDGVVLLAVDWAEPVPTTPGAPRARTFRLRGERTGTYRVTFELRRSWEPPDVAAAESRTVDVVVAAP